MFLAQTPQAFRRDILARALDEGKDVDATDEAMLVERLGVPVHVVEGDARNVKITTPEDLAAARSSEGDGFEPSLIRIGNGYDLHRLVAGPSADPRRRHDSVRAWARRPLRCRHRLSRGHGRDPRRRRRRRHRPAVSDTDPKWKGANSIELLKGAVASVREAGYRVSNVDVTVIAQKPKLLPYLDAMRANLAAALGVDPSAVSVKGKTNEGVDSMGRGNPWPAMRSHFRLLRS